MLLLVAVVALINCSPFMISKSVPTNKPGPLRPTRHEELIGSHEYLYWKKKYRIFNVSNNMS